jgi:DNA-binding SARP family transcriptional activator
MSEEKQTSLSATQELAPPTAADVLEVFQLFQANLLDRIDDRDENVLKAIRGIISDVLEQYQKQTARADDHEKRIKELERWLEIFKHRYNEIANEVATLKLKLGKTSGRVPESP